MNKNNQILRLSENDNYSGSQMPENIRLNSNINNNQKMKNQDGGNTIGKEGEMTEEEEKFFKDFTNPDIDCQDPSLGDNLIKIYEEEVPFEIRIEDENLSDNDKSIFQSLLCKVFVTDESIEDINIKIEIANDKDLFFYYSSNINSSLFDEIQEKQKLTCDFSNLADLLIKYFDLCIDEPKAYLAVLNLKSDKKAKMELFENLEYKFVELINIDFVPASDDLIREQISYRYNSMRALHEMTQSRIEIINSVLKDYDPQLINEVKTEINKTNEGSKGNNNNKKRSV